MPGLDVVMGVEKVVAVQLINKTSKWLLQCFILFIVVPLMVSVIRFLIKCIMHLTKFIETFFWEKYCDVDMHVCWHLLLVIKYLGQGHVSTILHLTTQRALLQI